MSLLYILTVGFAVSIDSIAAGIAYGIKNIRMPISSIFIIGAITCFFSAIAMILAYSFGAFVSTNLAMTCGAILLTLLGTLNVLREYLSKNLSREDDSFSASTYQLEHNILRIMMRPENADADHSKSISHLEAACLGIALGIDNSIATFSASLLGIISLLTPLIMGSIQMLFIGAGFWLSSRFTSPGFRQKVPYISGIILILLGLSRF